MPHTEKSKDHNRDEYGQHGQPDEDRCHDFRLALKVTLTWVLVLDRWHKFPLEPNVMLSGALLRVRSN